MSSRARGRSGLTSGPVTAPDSGAGREIGMSALQDPAGSPIPGGEQHIVNYPTVRREPDVGEPLPEFRGMEAHGVPPGAFEPHERGDDKPVNPPHSPRPARRPPAVPVYLTTREGGPEAYLSSSPRNVTIPSTAKDPVVVCGRNPKRNRVGLLNEDTATNIRFAVSPQGLVNGGGALLPYPNNSYLWLETQDTLYATTVSATLSVTLSVIEEFDQEL
jgi:hypothetical protein